MPLDMRKTIQQLLLVMGAMLLTVSVAVARPVISGVSMKVEDAAETITLVSKAPLKLVKQFALSNPERIVVDVESAEGKTVALPKDYDGDLIKTLRFGQFNPKLSRLVIETAKPVRVQGTKALASGGLAITLVDANRATSKTMQVSAPAKSTPKTEAAPVTKKVKKAESVPAPATEPAEDADSEADAPDVAAPTAKANEKLPLIVLDAGHGGQDPGASGGHDVHEKYITLAMVKQLRESLLATGRYRVALTRADDHYILLPERVNIARRLKADLFISIHADSNPNTAARGLSVYSVSETASDKESAALAERENKSDVIGGLNLNTADKDVANILIDLTQHETATKSLELADAMVAHMRGKVVMLPGTPHRFAGFRVLKAPDIPSVLVELGFLTNDRDEALLQNPTYRQQVAQAIVRGVDRFLSKKRK